MLLQRFKNTKWLFQRSKRALVHMCITSCFPILFANFYGYFSGSFPNCFSTGDHICIHLLFGILGKESIHDTILMRK